MYNYFRAISTLTGAIIGVGLFTIPYVANKSGFMPFLILCIFLAMAQYVLHSLYAEVVLSTKSYHRLPGYVSKYFHNNRARNIVLAITTIGNFGSMLAYILIGGIFLNQLLMPFFGDNLFLYTTILFLFQSIIVLFGINIISKMELIMTSLIFAMIGIIAWRTIPAVDMTNFVLIDYTKFFLPYGPVLVALSGTSAIPHVCRLLSHQKKKIQDTIRWSIGISMAVTIVFVFLVVGVGGDATSPDTLEGLKVFFSSLYPLVVVLGIVAIVSSYLITVEASREVFTWDFGMNKFLAWTIVCFVPYGLYILGVQNLTAVVSLTGAITGGLLGMVTIAIYVRAIKYPERQSVLHNSLSKIMIFFLVTLFAVGIIFQIYMPS